jgi:hypothetical protein
MYPHLKWIYGILMCTLNLKIIYIELNVAILSNFFFHIVKKIHSPIFFPAKVVYPIIWFFFPGLPSLVCQLLISQEFYCFSQVKCSLYIENCLFYSCNFSKSVMSLKFLFQRNGNIIYPFFPLYFVKPFNST